MGIFASPIPAGIKFAHPYRMVRWRTATRVLCDCGWTSAWMNGDVAAQHEADRHVAGGSNTWHWKDR